MKNYLTPVMSIAKAIQQENKPRRKPPTHNVKSSSEQVLAFSIVQGTRQYIERMVNEINSCYENGCFNGCSVLIRKLLETCIIELFEARKLDAKIKGANGSFLYLSELIDTTLSEGAWNLSRNAKKALPLLKDMGDKATHNRHYNAHRSDIDKMTADLRLVIQELLSLAGLK